MRMRAGTEVKSSCIFPVCCEVFLKMSSDFEDSFELESMSAKEVGTWLRQQGIPEKYSDVFEGKHFR